MQQPFSSPSGATRFDNDVTASILEVIDNAREYVVLVSPYIGHIGHVEQALKRAIQRGVRVLAVVRDDGPGRMGGSQGGQAIAWLQELNLELRAVERLHSKIYMNESAALITSMNLLPSSWSGSYEMAIRLSAGPDYASVRKYVFDRVLKLGRAIEAAPPAKVSEGSGSYSANRRNAGHQERQSSGRRTRRREEPEKSGFGAIVSKVRQVAGLGVCIRCATPIMLDHLHPLCEEHYVAWAKWKNPDYIEKYCHACGKGAETSYVRPLCRTCYRS